ncbi:MAG TPA: hypothetical protein VFJ93_07705 [Gaiellaceae bacterium]|nr:hypothetical protein [Gaiellaceae bacterium]
MALDTPPTASRPSRAVSRGRGRPETVTIRKTALLAGLIEGMALADEAMTAANDIQHAAAIGSRPLVVNLAGRLGHRATKARDEFRRLAGEVEE